MSTENFSVYDKPLDIPDRRGRMLVARRPPSLIQLIAILIVTGVSLPLGYLIFRALGVGSDFADLLLNSRTLGIVFRSAVLVIAVTLASVAIALPLAWLTVRTDLPFRRVWTIITVLPLVIPSYVAGFVMVVALGPKGVLQGWLSPLGVERLPEIYGFPGAMLTLTLLSYPYVLLPIRAALGRMDPALEETSYSLGKSSQHTFSHITFPLLRPSIAAGALLVALYTLSDFGAVSLLHYETFTWAIYVRYGYFARELAAVLSLVLVVFALGILVMEARTRGRALYYRSTTGSVRPQKIIHLGHWRWLALVFCAIVALFSLVIPVCILAYWVIRGVSAGEPLLLLWSHAANSLFVSGFAAVLAVIAAVPIAILVVRYPSRINGLLERFSYIGFALPGVVVALALVFFGVRYANPIYQTLWLLIFAYIILFLPSALGSIKASLLQISPRLEEAAMTLGRSHINVLFTIMFPLLRPGLLAGLALVFLLAMKELPATLMLGPIGFNTLATAIWGATEDGFFARAAAPSLLLIIASAIPMALLVLRGRREIL